jgi:hypothetical protein
MIWRWRLRRLRKRERVLLAKMDKARSRDARLKLRRS